MTISELVNGRYLARKTKLPHDLDNAKLISNLIKKYVVDGEKIEESLSEERMYKILSEVIRTNKREIQKDRNKAYVKLNHIADMTEVLFDRKIDRIRAGLMIDISVRCDVCKINAEFVDSKIVYHGRSYGMIWYCPCCRNYVGVHKGTNIPLSTITDKETKKARQNVHAALAKRFRSSDEAYSWLRRAMNLSKGKAHIGMFTKAECEKALQLLTI